MKVKWLGHASFLITSEKGLKLITDPYTSGGFGGALAYGPIRELADVVTVTHDHSDHNDVASLLGKPQVVKGPGVHKAKDIEFRFIPTFHDTEGGKQRGQNHMVTFTLDGIRVCHAGDLGHMPSKQQLSEIGPVDLLLLPVGGYFTIDAQTAHQVVEAIRPRVVIPMHFKTAKCNFPITPVEDFTRLRPRAKVMDSSEAEFKAGALPQPTETVVLKHAL